MNRSSESTVVAWSVLAVTMLASPFSAMAYLTPQQVFFNPVSSSSSAQTQATSSSSATTGATTDGGAGPRYNSEQAQFQNIPNPFTSPPATRRNADDRVAAQQSSIAADRAYYQQFLDPNYRAPTLSSSAALTGTNASRSCGNRLSDECQYQVRQERLADASRSGTVLRSGAPSISATGPADVIAAGALMLAAVSTYLLALKRGKINLKKFFSSHV